MADIDDVDDVLIMMTEEAADAGAGGTVDQLGQVVSSGADHVSVGDAAVGLGRQAAVPAAQ